MTYYEKTLVFPVYLQILCQNSLTVVQSAATMDRSVVWEFWVDPGLIYEQF